MGKSDKKIQIIDIIVISTDNLQEMYETKMEKYETISSRNKNNVK